MIVYYWPFPLLRECFFDDQGAKWVLLVEKYNVNYNNVTM